MRKIHSFNTRCKNVHTFRTQLGGKMVGFKLGGATDQSNRLKGVVMPVKSGAGPHHIKACGHTAQYLPYKEIEDIMRYKRSLDEKMKYASELTKEEPGTILELQRRGSSQMILRELGLEKNLNQYFKMQDKEKKLNKLENIHKRIKSLNQASLDLVNQRITDHMQSRDD